MAHVAAARRHLLGEAHGQHAPLRAHLIVRGVLVRPGAAHRAQVNPELANREVVRREVQHHDLAHHALETLARVRRGQAMHARLARAQGDPSRDRDVTHVQIQALSGRSRRGGPLAIDHVHPVVRRLTAHTVIARARRDVLAMIGDRAGVWAIRGQQAMGVADRHDPVRDPVREPAAIRA